MSEQKRDGERIRVKEREQEWQSGLFRVLKCALQLNPVQISREVLAALAIVNWQRPEGAGTGGR